MKVNNSTNKFNVKIYQDNFQTYDGEKKAADVVAEIKNAKGEVLLSKRAFLTEDMLFVLAHPEVEEGGFTRFGNWIKDPILRFMSGSGACMMYDHPYMKALDAKNLKNPEYRIFDSIPNGQNEREILHYEIKARETISKIEKFLKRIVSEYGISKKEITQEAKKVLKVLA